MNKQPFLLDCDPGVDDAVAILLARRLRSLELVAVTTVAGNVELEHTTRNALIALELAGFYDIPVYPGAAKPLFGEPVTAHHVHGQNGLGNLAVAPPKRAPEPKRAWEAIIDTAKEYKGELTIVAIGPLTNLALAFLKDSSLPRKLRRIVLMGGAAVGGNATPCAEFNIYADPEAAKLVFSRGVPVVMCGLDATAPSYLTAEELDEVAALGTRQAAFVRDVLQGILRYSRSLGLPGVCLHDPAALLYADDDACFVSKAAGVCVETKGKLTRGKTVTDLYSDKQMEKNAVVVTGVDREALKARIFDSLARFGETE